MTDQERLAALLAKVDAEWTQDSHGEGWYAFFAARLIASGVGFGSDLDVERLARALSGVNPKLYSRDGKGISEWSIRDAEALAVAYAAVGDADPPGYRENRAPWQGGPQ